MQLDGTWKNLTNPRADYLYNGKELEEELGLDWLAFGARYLDPATGRFTGVDRYADQFAFQTPYAYAGNSPIINIDVNGDSTYLLIWATADGETGHAGIAVNNYDKDGKTDGTYTYYDLWPGGEVAAKDFREDVIARYQEDGKGQIIGSAEDLMNFTVNGAEPHKPDGIIGFPTEEVGDQLVKDALSSIGESKVNYNGISFNCSTFASIGVEIASGEKLDADEKLGRHLSVTPNALYRASAKLQEAHIIRNPGVRVHNKFLDGAILNPQAWSRARKMLNR